MKKVAVVGASGMLGEPVTLALARAGFAVTAITRDAGRMADRFPDGVRVVSADVRDVDSLVAAFEGQDFVHLNLSVDAESGMSGFQTEGAGMRNIITAARAAKVRRIGYLSALIHDTQKSDWWVLKLWRQAIADLKSSGIPISIYYASNFMDTLPARHVFGDFLVMPAKGRKRQFWIAAADFGRQVACDLSHEGDDIREYSIQGPEAIGYEEAARRYVDASGRGLRIVTVPVFTLAVAGLFSRAVEFDRRVMTTVLDYDETFKAEATWRDLGTPATTIEAFARGARH